MQTKTLDLPLPVDDLVQVELDLAEFGVGLLTNALSPERLQSLRQGLAAQAHAERQAGKAFLENGNMDRTTAGPNQRVFGLIGKGQIFRELAVDPRALEPASKLFGAGYGVPQPFVRQAELDELLLSSMTANIVGPGSTAMTLHADQAYMPATTPYPGVVNVIWLLSDFTADNGATLVAPGSHRAENPLQYFLEPPVCVPLVAPAGTAVFLDGRTWHGTGENRTDTNRSAIFAYYCRPFMRQQENYALTLSSEQCQDFSEQLLRLLGYRVWFTLGCVEGAQQGNSLGQ